MAVLDQGVGYGVVLGIGIAFALAMIGITMALKRYQSDVIDSEEFATAGRSIKSGLISAAVVSSWTWAASLLQSTTEVYKNGVSGAFYYAAGATVQIILFATLALELKSKCPNARTYLEIIKQRYGTLAHVIFMFFAVVTNILVTAMLLTGGAAVINELTGMNQVAACFLIPIGVVAYTLFGGIKATFITDYSHTVIMIGIIFAYLFRTYASSSSSFLGSPSKVYDVITSLGNQEPIDGNAQGSLLTLSSKSGGIFFVINLAGNFGTVFLDNGYWNKAISAAPRAALPGYFLGGLSWFVIPFSCATTLGLACKAAVHSGVISKLSSEEVTAGLALPNGAVALFGPTGAGLALVMLYMAITSAFSSQLIAVSSICTFDIYKTYISPAAGNKQLIFVTHASVVMFGISMSGFSTGLYYIGVGMGFLYLLMGVLISSAVLPLVLSLTWSWQSKLAACVTPILGLSCGLIAWLTCCKSLYGEINITTSGMDLPMLAGNVASLCSPLVFSPLLSIFRPQRYDFKNLLSLKSMRDGDDETVTDNNNSSNDSLPKGYLKLARIICCVVTLSLLILWPMPMYGTKYVFSKPFFTGWIVVSFIWLFFTFFMVGVYPVYESRHGLAVTFKGIYQDITGKKKSKDQFIDTSSSSSLPLDSKNT